MVFGGLLLFIDVLFIVALPQEQVILTIVSIDGFFIYFLALPLSGKATFLFMEAPPPRFNLFNTHRVLRALMSCVILLLIVSIFGIYLTGNDIVRRIGGSAFSLVFMMYMVVRVLSHSLNIFHKAGGIEPDKHLVDSMMANLPIVVMFFGSFWSVFMRNLGIAGMSPLLDFDVYLLLILVPVFYVVCVELPFSYGMRHWKQRALTFLRHRQARLMDAATRISEGARSQKALPTKRLLEKTNLELELNRVGQMILEVKGSPSHPYSAAIVLASAVFYVILSLMVEPLIRAFLLIVS